MVSFEAGTIKRARTATGIMQQKRFLIPYQLELANELNIERFQLTKAGQIQFSLPDGAHDDRTWHRISRVRDEDAAGPRIQTDYPSVLTG